MHVNIHNIIMFEVILKFPKAKWGHWQQHPLDEELVGINWSLSNLYVHCVAFNGNKCFPVDGDGLIMPWGASI